MALTVGSLFSGIGGLDLGLERAGMEVRWQCEIDLYCQSILRRHWPDATLYGDIHDLDGSAERVDLICGGFPCQPVSVAGKGLAQEDPRWLWPEFHRLVGLLRPRYVVVENVPGLRKRGLGDVIGDLAALGYDAEWQVVSAASVGAPHMRKRLIVVAYPGGEHLRIERGWFKRTSRQDSVLLTGDGEEGPVGTLAHSNDTGRRQLRWAGAAEEKLLAAKCGGGWESEPQVGRVADGVPGRVAQLRALGNAVVPQVAEFVGRLIVEAEAA